MPKIENEKTIAEEKEKEDSVINESPLENLLLNVNEEQDLDDKLEIATSPIVN